MNAATNAWRGQLIRILLGALFVVATLRPAVASGQPGTVTLTVDALEIADFPAIRAYVTVRDENGVPIPEQAVDDFQLSEDRSPQLVHPSTLTTRLNPDSASWIVLAIDISGSMAGERMTDAQAAATRFLDAMGPSDHVAVYAFTEEVALDAADPAHEVPFTTDKAPLYSFIAGLQAGGRTPLYDAAYKTVLMLDAAPAAAPRAVLLLTDGRDEGSRVAGRDTAVTEAQRRAVPVFTIGLADADTSFIQELARRTGGLYRPAENSAALGDLFDDVAGMLRNQYVLEFQSALPADGREHRLEVRVTIDGGQAITEVSLGPVPFNPTPTAEPTDAPLPTGTITVLPTALPPTSTPRPTQMPAPASDTSRTASPALQVPSVGGWLMVAGLAIVLAGGFAFAVSRRRQNPSGWRCRYCGYSLEHRPAGPCPSCGKG
jgi:VWFA-related protein